jgi:hypothetical protein
MRLMMSPPSVVREPIARGRSPFVAVTGALLALVVAAASVLIAVWALPASAQVAPAAAPLELDFGTSVMGPSTVTAKQLADYYYSKKGHDFARIPTLDGDVQRLAAVFISEGKKDGVRGDIAFMQSMLETGWLEFKDYGQIRPDFNNFAGMFAYDGRPIGTTCAAEEAEEAAGGLKSRCFDSPELGVRAQIHKLRSYADPSVANVSGRLGYAPTYSRGTAPYWEQFGGASGIAIWATARDYGDYILTKMYFPMLQRLGVTMPCVPAGSTVTGTSGSGYWVVGRSGASSVHGTAPALGAAVDAGAKTAVVDVAANADGSGYWQATEGGGVYAFGGAESFGSLANAKIASEVVGITSTPSGEGYWLATSDGAVFPFGDADDHGSLITEVLRSPVIDIERTSDGAGYWLLQGDGAIHAFGNAGAIESPKSRGTERGVIALTRTATGKGYYVLTLHGRVQAYGDAVRAGDIYGCGLGAAVDVQAARTGTGYWITTASGTVFAFGTASYLGGPSTLDGGAVAFALAT